MNSIMQENNISISEQYRNEIQKENLKFQCYLKLESLFSKAPEQLKESLNLRIKSARDLNFEEFLELLHGLNLSLVLRNHSGENEVTIFKQ